MHCCYSWLINSTLQCSMCLFLLQCIRTIYIRVEYCSAMQHMHAYAECECVALGTFGHICMWKYKKCDVSRHLVSTNSMRINRIMISIWSAYLYIQILCKRLSTSCTHIDNGHANVSLVLRIRIRTLMRTGLGILEAKLACWFSQHDQVHPPKLDYTYCMQWSAR